MKTFLCRCDKILTYCVIRQREKWSLTTLWNLFDMTTGNSCKNINVLTAARVWLIYFNISTNIYHFRSSNFAQCAKGIKVMEQLHKTHAPTAKHSTVECYQPIYPELLWQSLSLWLISICVNSVRGGQHERHLIICSDWMDIMAGLCPFSGPGRRYDESEDTVSADAYSLWCCSVMVHIKVIKRVRVKNDDAFSVFISWRWILEYLHGWVDYIWCVQISSW